MTQLDDQGRPEPPAHADELATLNGFLEFHRATFAWKTAGLGAEQLNRTIGGSTMTLGGMIKHLALVEDDWFVYWLANEPHPEPWASVDWDADRDWDWHSAVDDTPDQLRELWAASVERARRAAAQAVERGGLDVIALRPWKNDDAPSARWIIVHMIEEYARHNGHADLIRESIDGQTGE